MESPSRPQEIYGRLPEALHAGPATLTVTTLDDGLSRNPYPIEVSDAAAAPLLLRVCAAGTLPCPEIASVARNQQIGLLALGTDTSGAVAIFSQGDLVVEKTSQSTLSSDAGLLNQFRVPNSLPDGPALVQISAGGSARSAAIRSP